MLYIVLTIYIIWYITDFFLLDKLLLYMIFENVTSFISFTLNQTVLMMKVSQRIECNILLIKN